MPRSDDAPIMIVAGEASGDLHGATLCRALRVAGARTAAWSGWAASAWPRPGSSALADVTAAAVVGGTEAFGPLATLYRAWRRLRPSLRRPEPPRRRSSSSTSPSSICAWPAWPGGPAFPVVYFIPPQVWAWRPWRIRAIRRRVSLCWRCCPFEVALYRRPPACRWSSSAIPCSTRVARRPRARRRAAARRSPPEATCVGLLPGSRAPGDRAHAAGAARRRGPDRRRRVPAPASCWRWRRRSTRAGRAAVARARRPSIQSCRRRPRGHARGRPLARDLGHGDARGRAARHADDRLLSASRVSARPGCACWCACPGSASPTSRSAAAWCRSSTSARSRPSGSPPRPLRLLDVAGGAAPPSARRSRELGGPSASRVSAARGPPRPRDVAVGGGARLAAHR